MKKVNYRVFNMVGFRQLARLLEPHEIAALGIPIFLRLIASYQEIISINITYHVKEEFSSFLMVLSDFRLKLIFMKKNPVLKL